ncbi:Ni/Fe hydrogenase subunit alpha (plasmid) [Lichenicola cladoniae]|uniref:Ni/Fe hydrogenase subunit alpha n=1 Tax=Lichenicola cladoniae TaxID=1484109 RepID=A0A6M8HZI0_9PROT|nr:Ni/Fe hydrogenase subunit alpha [Lichenicola cladoniae]NPD68184.1 Ni/Fe hydrogenase subunit alpha [Acetobacteraceae bacterium]QKE93565.1 Ni/Fe hydrogenase subunit alpha [Lichenicola cladoniae]
MTDIELSRGPRKIVIDPVTRVEGHGKVTIRLNEAGEVEQARFHVVEFRGFERFIQGRMYWEVPVIVQRLCGICPVSHHLGAAKAMDVIAGVDQVTPTAEKMRRLMHYGQVLQSNAVNFFHLASPDLLLGFDAPVEQRNIIGVMNAFPEVGKWAIFIRKFGQQVIAATGGRRIHPRLCVPGGVNQNLSIENRDMLRKDVDQIVQWCRDALELHKSFVHSHEALHENFASFPSSYMSLVGADGGMDLYDGTLRAIDADNTPIFEGVQPADYADYIVEEVRSWSYMKFPHIRSLGREHGWYRVGPLAQLNCCAFIGTPIANAARTEFMAQGRGGLVHSTLSYHWARLICMIHCAEKIRELLFDDDLQGTDLVLTGTRRPEGVAIIEAPRGTLIHHYTVDDNDQVSGANLIVSTTNNNEAMNRSVKQVAVEYLTGHEITEGLLNHIEVAIRAYDPCLSCATHAIGQMPLVVTLEDADGAVIATRVKQ